MPVIIGPTGPAGFVWYRGELALAKAAKKAGIPFALASTSNTSMERIINEGGGRQWFHLYIWRDMEASLEAVPRAKAAGFEALILTVDSTVPYNREFDVLARANGIPAFLAALASASSPRYQTKPAGPVGPMIPGMFILPPKNSD